MNTEKLKIDHKFMSTRALKKSLILAKARRNPDLVETIEQILKDRGVTLPER